MRILTLSCGLLGALCMSQLPAFSDAYLQRLGGQNDALQAVIAAFDASAAKVGLTRDQALEDLSGSKFQLAHQADMRQTFKRAKRVEEDLTFLRSAAPLERIILPHRYRDTETLAAAWDDFRPALPASLDGFLAALVGFLAGVSAYQFCGWLLMFLFGRRAATR